MAFSDSALATYSRISPNCNIPRNQPISKVTIHHMAGVNTVESFGNIVANASREMTSNYAIGNDGRIGLFCHESNRSWCTSSEWNDNRAITIEVSNCAVGDDSGWPISNEAYTSLIRLCVDICQRNGIKKLEFDGTIYGSLTYHYQFWSTQCPGPYIKNHTKDICDKVNLLLSQHPTISQLQAYTQTAGDAVDLSAYPTASEYALTGTTISVEPDYKAIKAYMTTLDRTSKKVDYEALKEEGVIGSLIEAGYMYDTSHMVMNTFVSPTLEAQVKAAKEADIPYGLFTYTRARSITEANLELKWLRIYIQKYTPSLGVWLKLELVNDKDINDMIVGRYKTLLEASGLKGRMGFYVTRDQLSRISWDKWQDDFLLWLVDHVDNVSELDTLLDPTFFDL